MSKKIIKETEKIVNENGEVQEIPLLKKAFKLFLWYLVGRWGGYVLIFVLLGVVGSW